MALIPHALKAALALTLLHSVWQVALLALLAAAVPEPWPLAVNV